MNKPFAFKKQNLLVYLFVVQLILAFVTLAGVSDKTHLGALFFIGIIAMLALTYFLCFLYFDDQSVAKQVVVDETKDSEKIEKKEDVEEDSQHTIESVKSKIIKLLHKTKTHQEWAEVLLQNIAKQFDFVQGIVYIYNKQTKYFEPASLYAWYKDSKPESFAEGDTVSGQVAKNKEMLCITNVPDNYLVVQSGLGSTHPRNILIVPVVSADKTIAIIEVASFKALDKFGRDVFTALSTELAESLVARTKRE
jgi:hypothetical protein